MYITPFIGTVPHIGKPIMDISSLSKGQIRKLNALKKSIGDDLGEKAFTEWLTKQPKGSPAKSDPIAEKIVSALSQFENDKSFRLGRKGYSIKRAKGRGVSGFVVSKID
jgi:hypothetical protein